MQEVRCRHCGYDIFCVPADPVTGLWHCPECGRQHTNAELSREANEHARRAEWYRTRGRVMLIAVIAAALVTGLVAAVLLKLA